MLTLEKLKVYQRFGGDIDGWAQVSRRGDASGITDDDWSLIDQLQQGLHLLASGRAVPQFERWADERLVSVTADEPTRELLRTLASEGSRLCRRAYSVIKPQLVSPMLLTFLTTGSRNADAEHRSFTSRTGSSLGRTFLELPHLDWPIAWRWGRGAANCAGRSSGRKTFDMRDPRRCFLTPNSARRNRAGSKPRLQMPRTHRTLPPTA